MVGGTQIGKGPFKKRALADNSAKWMGKIMKDVPLYQQKLLSPHVINQLKHQPELQKILLEKIDI